MRTLAITQNITVDGVVEMLGDWFDPTADLPEVNAALRAQSARSDALLVGRQTFEDLRGYWPQQTDDETGVAAHLDAVTKHVVSQTLDDPGWAGSEVLRGPVVDEVRRLKDRPGADIVVTGSIRLCHELVAAGLVDEYRLFVHPVLSGSGRRLFEGATGPLELVEARRLDGRIELLVYRATRPRRD